MKLHDNWQDSISLTMDTFFLGTGWHEIEKVDQVYFRWTGPEPVSTIHLYPQRSQSNRLNMIIHASASENILKVLRLEADGIPLQTTLSKKREPAYLTAVLPADLSKREGDKTVLTLHLPKTSATSQINPDTNDNRVFGIALQRIDIFPLSRALFIARKYNDPEPFDGLHYIRHNPGVRDAVIHGAYASAYEYFLKHDRTGIEDAFELHEHFDECPGDMFDILNNDMKERSKKLEEKYQEEITLLRDIVYRQGDAIRTLKGQGNGSK